ncbi:hypothetical protein ABI_11490 [Asticcacaulis biprosthecium C19]|uniref:DUF1211 domain-containing protein n=1 Tax=Asticcacaulis biprosthecium C19 TaxID=715226 RepID=F4QHH5_9CAUL|nr:TMEM175 family protein [Asticcacaulis biprosthecium]EGF92712.1 hypothetical protein ABI_11490 [Asticcacaulis biprosthecium C19]
MSHHESNARGHDGRMVDRMLFFSDAVFAIVLTIMVLELHAPVVEHFANERAGSAELWDGVAHLGRLLFAYGVSFALVGMWWSIHMRVTRLLTAFDWPTATMNLVFLFTVSMAPFASSVLGENLRLGAAWQIYWGVNAATSVALTVMMLVVSRGGGKLLVGGMAGRERFARLLQAIGPGVGFSVGVYLAGIGEVQLSQWCWIFILPVMFLARLVWNPKKSVVE